MPGAVACRTINQTRACAGPQGLAAGSLSGFLTCFLGQRSGLQRHTQGLANSVLDLKRNVWIFAQKLARVLTNDPGMGVIRHADAGYDLAVDVAREKHVHVPMLDTEGE